MTADTRVAIPVREAAERMGISYETLRRKIKAGTFKPVAHIGPKAMVPLTTIEAWLRGELE